MDWVACNLEISEDSASLIAFPGRIWHSALFDMTSIPDVYDFRRMKALAGSGRTQTGSCPFRKIDKQEEIMTTGSDWTASEF